MPSSAEHPRAFVPGFQSVRPASFFGGALVELRWDIHAVGGSCGTWTVGVGGAACQTCPEGGPLPRR
jgi:hypothetical protein